MVLIVKWLGQMMDVATLHVARFSSLVSNVSSSLLIVSVPKVTDTGKEQRYLFPITHLSLDD